MRREIVATYKAESRVTQESTYRRHRFNPCVGKSPGGRDGSPLQCSCLEKLTGPGAWQGTTYGVAKNQTRLNNGES